MTSQIHLPGKPKSQPDYEQDVAQDVEAIIKLAPTLAFQKFCTRDLAVATVKHTEDLKEHETPEERPIGAVQKNERCGDRNQEDQQSPSIWSSGKSQEKTRHHARNRTIQLSGDETVLGLATITQELYLDLVDLAPIRDIFPRPLARARQHRHLVEIIFPGILLSLRGNDFGQRRRC